MSTLFKIKKIIINNFKLFGKKKIINFDCNDLIVFDGPNGHGKTTVYDAIELAITGDIRRLYSTESQQIPSDVVVAHKNSSDCFVILELQNDDNSISIERKLKKKIANQDKKILNFKNLWDLNIIKDSKSEKISQKQLNEIVGNLNLPRDFNLFHYVEQEDTAHFLKSKKEKERAEALSVLFGDTLEMQGKINKIDEFIRKIDSIVKEKNKSKVRLELRGNIKETSLSNSELVHYFSLLSWSNSPFDFDKEDLNDLNIEKKDNYLLEINSIKKLNENKNHFLLKWKHKLICEKDNILKNFILHYNYIGEFSKLKTNVENEKKINEIITLLTIDNFTSITSNQNLSYILDLIDFKEQNVFISKINSIKNGINNNNTGNNLILDILDQRSKLKSYILNSENQSDCTLCGKKYNDRDELIKLINEKENSIKQLLSSESNRLSNDKQVMFNNEISTLKIDLDSYVKKLKLISNEHLESLGHASNEFENISKFKSWLDDNNIEYLDLLSEFQFELQSGSLTDINLVELKRRIMAKVVNSPLGYDDTDEEVKFENVFKIYFDSKPSLLRGITDENIIKKTDYINFKYIESISNDIKEYDAIKSELEILDNKKTNAFTLRKNLTSAISKFQKRLIKDIEIPFYIYSGKVLQSHQSGIGNGIFIKDKTGGEELKNIRLVSDWNSDHDVINTMSSGQIAATVISLYLALNKVYSKGFSPILIDDPVQTMDEINMISLVELLRNEFSDRQIVLSTHEDHVSRYFIYKFLKYRKPVRQIKLLEMKEYQLANNS